MKRAQTQTNTHLFRRTDVLRSAHAQLRERSQPTLKLLSFGCSTGEEVVTLRCIFPQAQIFGCEIEPDILEIARRSVGQIGHVFPSSPEAVRAGGPYDLICCSAVLCRNPPKDIRTLFPASQFEDILGLLDTTLAPGGLLAITNASYRFHDSPLAARYDSVRSDIVSSSGFVDVFAHDGQPFLARIPGHPQVAFRRGPAFEVKEAEELADSLFRKRMEGEPSAPLRLAVAPVPTNFVPDFQFERSNLAGLASSDRTDALEVIRRYQFGRDPQSGKFGCAIQLSWIGMSGAEHVRPPYWAQISEFFGE